MHLYRIRAVMVVPPAAIPGLRIFCATSCLVVAVGDDTVNRTARDLVLPGDIRNFHRRVFHQYPYFMALLLRQLLAPPPPPATTCTCGLESGYRAFPDQVALKFRQRGKNMEHQLAGRAVGADLLVQAVQADTLFFQLCDQCQKFR